MRDERDTLQLLPFRLSSASVLFLLRSLRSLSCCPSLSRSSSSIGLSRLVRSPSKVPLQEASVYCCIDASCLLSLALLTSALTSRSLSARNATLDCKHRELSMRDPPDSRICNQVSSPRITRSTERAAFGRVDR